MDVSLHSRAEQLAAEFASQAKTAEDLNGLMRLMMKSALERMLNTELDVHLGRRSVSQLAAPEPSQDGTNEPSRVAVASPRNGSRNRRNGKSPAIGRARLSRS